MTDIDDWTGTDIGSIPIGQGVSVNAVQMLQVFNTFANGGVWVAPRLVRSTIDGDGREHVVESAEPRRVVSERTADQMTAMLASAVNTGTGTNAGIDGYTVAGKTGTARKPDGGGNYEFGAYISSFAGFVPAEAPRLSAIVSFDEPRPVYYASQVAAPVFSAISKYALRLLRIPPPAVPSLPVVPDAKPVDGVLKD
jgi:cell division protein FtsI (penicillin-binding protein 3)